MLWSEEAAAFCRRTTCPSCPVDPTTGCPTGGKPVAWPRECVSYALARAASRQVTLAEATEIVAAAFRTWESVTCPGTSSQPSIVASNAFGPTDCAEALYAQAGPNANAIIFHDDVWPYEELEDSLALTTTRFDEETGDILDSDIEIDATLPLSTSDAVPPKSYDLQSILTHEAGHFLGLAHSREFGATMQAGYRPGSDGQRVLGDDDVAGICAIYPPDRDALPCDYTPIGRFQAGCPAAEASGGCSLSRRAEHVDAFVPAGVAAWVLSLRMRRARRSKAACRAL